jgi:CRP/FNR family transcriptional regulator
MDEIKQVLREYFPQMLDGRLVEQIAGVGRLAHLRAGEVMMEHGALIRHVPMVLSGTIKVMRLDEDGNELLLYYLERGDTCAMSLTCCMADGHSAIRAVVFEDARMLLVPARYMDDWMAFRDWRAFVMGTYRKRFEEMLGLVDSIAFLHMDQRILRYLEERREVTGTDELNLAHQDIANDLNTSREVVSRLLKQMERQGIIELRRNAIRMLS